MSLSTSRMPSEGLVVGHFPPSIASARTDVLTRFTDLLEHFKNGLKGSPLSMDVDGRKIATKKALEFLTAVELLYAASDEFVRKVSRLLQDSVAESADCEREKKTVTDGLQQCEEMQRSLETRYAALMEQRATLIKDEYQVQNDISRMEASQEAHRRGALVACLLGPVGVAVSFVHLYSLQEGKDRLRKLQQQLCVLELDANDCLLESEDVDSELTVLRTKLDRLRLDNALFLYHKVELEVQQDALIKLNQRLKEELPEIGFLRNRAVQLEYGVAQYFSFIVDLNSVLKRSGDTFDKMETVMQTDKTTKDHWSKHCTYQSHLLHWLMEKPSLGERVAQALLGRNSGY